MGASQVGEARRERFQKRSIGRADESASQTPQWLDRVPTGHATVDEAQDRTSSAEDGEIQRGRRCSRSAALRRVVEGTMEHVRVRAASNVQCCGEGWWRLRRLELHQPKTEGGKGVTTPKPCAAHVHRQSRFDAGSLRLSQAEVSS